VPPALDQEEDLPEEAPSEFIPLSLGEEGSHSPLSQPEDLPPRGLARVAGLEHFALTGLAPAFSVPKPTFGPTQLQEHMWVSARGGETLQRVPIDKLELTYKVGAGPFQAPPSPGGCWRTDKE